MKRKIIACLDIKDGKVVKGVNFEGLKLAGDPIELAQKYEQDGADELVFLDISATLEGRETVANLVKEVAQKISIPLTVGGGIKSVDEALKIIAAGASKISIGTAAVNNPQLITDIAQKIGKEKLTVAVDYKKIGDEILVVIKGGKEPTDISLFDWVKSIEKLGAGELLLTSMDHDGMKGGFDLEILQKVSEMVSIPVVASGGAGTIDDFKALFSKTKVQTGLGAGVFHFGDINIKTLKQELKEWI